MFAPARGVENPIVRRAVDLCGQAGMKVIYHEDAVEVWFSPGEIRFYTTWNQFLTDAEMLFGTRMQDAPQLEPAEPEAPELEAREAEAPVFEARLAEPPLRARFGNRPAPVREFAAANGAAHANGHAAAAAADDAAHAEIKRLRAEVRLLERAIKVVGMQSEEWKRESEAARQEVANARTETANLVEARLAQANQGVDRYRLVRQIIVKRLHPDIGGAAEEKAYRETLFKAIWQDIEALDRK